MELDCPPEDKLVWTLLPQLAADREKGRWAVCRQEDNSVRMENGANTDFPGQVITLSASLPFAAVTLPQVGDRRLRLELAAERHLVLEVSAAPRQGADGKPDYGTALDVLERTCVHWRELASPLTVETPDETLNSYLSFWCLYQTVACRLYARTSLYQCGGAYGFRDQLQDACALIPSAPALFREQVLRCCAHQYEEGDVQHWWHPNGTGRPHRGVRTRITDDLLWLPWALGQWYEATNDTDLLNAEAPLLHSPPLDAGQQERYEEPEVSSRAVSVYRHCVLALEQALGRGTGPHGLLLMGTGDWNDGMDKVGREGRGESVWLTWFAAWTLRRFAPLCGLMGEHKRRERYLSLARRLTEQAGQSWDGAWYRRAYFDSGAPLGSAKSPECRVDSIAQSFAVLCQPQPGQRETQAIQSARESLFDREGQLIQLLSPPFDGAGEDAGYIGTYPPGIRENGGQYTHAAVWLALAHLKLGDGENGWALLRALLPGHHPQERYLAEPYVLAADVYSHPQYRGRGGWSWYTGAAGWYYQAAVTGLLGLRLTGGKLEISPTLPASWPGYRAVWRTSKAQLHIQVRREQPPGVWLDGRTVAGGIRLDRLAGSHTITVRI